MHTANVIYKSFILPVLDCCDLVWGCCGRVNADNFERLQRRTARIIMRTSSSDEAIKYLRYDTLELLTAREARVKIGKALPSGACSSIF